MDRLRKFLTDQGLGDQMPDPLAGDASARRYWRLQTQSGPRVVMDADPITGEDVTRFAHLARHLRSYGVSAPSLHAEDAKAGFLLMEDFGDGLLARLVAHDPSRERTLYGAAVDLLVALRDVPPGEVPVYDSAAMAQAIDLVFADYLCRAAPSADFALVAPLLKSKLDQLCPDTPVLCLRDYHAENLFWLPEREAAACIGVIDFQDAVLAHPAYDMASLLHDARRDVSADVIRAMQMRYCTATQTDPERFAASFAVLSLQRNLRILGVFARLARSRGKPGYLSLMPRVWAFVQAALAHPELAELADALHGMLPAPTPEHLERLRAA